MTGPEALHLLRQRRALLGEQARCDRAMGIDAYPLDTEAEALSWAITFIEAARAQPAKAWGGPL